MLPCIPMAFFFNNWNFVPLTTFIYFAEPQTSASGNLQSVLIIYELAFMMLIVLDSMCKWN